MTQQELDALKALADAATPTNRLERDGYHIYYRANFAEWQAHAVFPGGTDEAIYYMAMRAAVPALIAEVERLQVAWSAEHDAYIRADEQARMARREVERLRAELARLRRIADGVRRAYAMYHATALQVGVEPLTFDAWFACNVGEPL